MILVRLILQKIDYYLRFWMKLLVSVGTQKQLLKGNLSKNEYSLLLGNSSDSKKYHNKIYLTDGFIIHYKKKELKLKPYDMMTIDIKFDSSKKIWFDREGNNMNDYIDVNESIRHQMSSIWRCYPIIKPEGVRFIPKEKREDKRRANPNKIIRQIIDYLDNLQVKYYQNLKNHLYQILVLSDDNLKDSIVLLENII